MINRKKVDKLLTKKLSQYTTSTEFINDIHKFGLCRHGCMILELILLGRSYDRIKRILLFTDDKFTSYVDEIYFFLKDFKKKKSFFKIPFEV